MSLRTFMERPVLSAVISITIVIVSITGLFSLPVEQYPDIAPPTIMVSTTYYGTSTEILQKNVIAPLEETVNEVEDITYMAFSVTNPSSVSITVYFKQGTDPDVAAVDVQNRASRTAGQFPAEVTQAGVTTSKRQTSTLQTFSLYSSNDSYDENSLSNYISISLRPQTLRISSVSDLVIMSGRHNMCVQMKPDVMTQYKLIPSDITGVLAGQNTESTTGSFGENSDETYQYTMKYTGHLITPEEFGDIVIRFTNNGEVLKPKDVADIQLGQDSYAYHGGMDGHPGVSYIALQTVGSNTTEVNQNADKLLEEASKDLPKGVELTQVMSSNDFLFALIHEAVKALIEAVILAVLMAYVFLQDFRSTLIPLVGIMASLVGTFASMMIAGFNVNLLTLFALVLVIGTAADDVIIVVEAMRTRFDVGCRLSYMTSIDAMKGVSDAVITSSLVPMTVFIPVSLMDGTSSMFYIQFGLAMAVAVGISAINALTLSPALCMLLLKPYINEDGTQRSNFAARFRKAFNLAFDVVVDRYKTIVLFFIKRRWLTWSLLACSVVLLVLSINNTKTSLVPDEDQGVTFVDVNATASSSPTTTDKVMERTEKRLIGIPRLKHVQKVTDYGLLVGQDNSFGMLILKLKLWDECPGDEDNVQSVIGQACTHTVDTKDASVFAISLGMIPGYDMGNALEFHIQDKTGGDTNELFTTTQQYLGALNQRSEISMACSTFDVRYPQWTIEVDVAKCKRAGIMPDAVLSTLSGYYGEQYVSNFNRFSKMYRVMIRADPVFHLDGTSLDNAFVRMSNGEMAPLSQFVTLTRSYSAESLSRFNIYNSIAVNAMPVGGYSTGDAIRAVQEIAGQSLPKGCDYDYGGTTREENQQSGTTIIISGICFLMTYLILSAPYESFIIPFAALLSVPCGLMGSFLFAWMFGLENNVYLQTGLTMLIGPLAKTAILLTKYAVERCKTGIGLVASVVDAAKAYLRPVLMTALTMIFGLLPLMMSSGIGASDSRLLGTGVVGSMTIGTLALFFIVLTLLIVFQRLQEHLHPVQSVPTHDWQIEEETKVGEEEKSEVGKE